MGAMLDADASRVEVSAHYASFDRLIAVAEATAAGWPRRDVLRLILVIEELFTNSVGHGYGGECEKPVRLTLARRGELISACYEDEAPFFDPRAEFTAPLPTEPGAVGGPLGGVGLWLVRHYVHDCRHERRNGTNRTLFSMQPSA